MGVKLTGDSTLKQRLSNIGERSTRETLAALRAGGKAIVDRARQYVPEDYGNLESAIKQDEERTGINGRMEISVFVDGSTPAPERGPGVTVQDYALMLHEDPRFWTQLGEKSREKAKRLGVRVGPKYLERAADELAPEIHRNVVEALKGATR